MEAILDVFGIDWKLLVVQTVNFLVLLAALGYFLYRPIMKLLDDRKKIVSDGVINAEKAERALAEATKESEAQIGRAAFEANVLVEKAKKEAMAKGSVIVRDAEERGSALVREAEAAAAEEKRRKVQEAEQEIARMVVLGIEKTVRAK